jgi:hypothetical protein
MTEFLQIGSQVAKKDFCPASQSAEFIEGNIDRIG